MVHETLAVNYFACCGLTPPPFALTYHQQDNHGAKLYCGAASAQMILDSIGASLLDQEDLYDSNQLHGSVDTGAFWHAPPDGLTCTLNILKPTTFSNVFQLADLMAEEAISRKICWAIHEHGVAPIALVESGDHWLTVVGYTASASPTSETDTSYDIESFDVYNPWPPTPGPPPPIPPPHQNGADQCGTGKTTGKDRGNQFEFIVYKKPGTAPSRKKYWRTYYMKPVAKGTLWNGRYFAICDPDAPAETEDTPPELDEELEQDLAVIQTLATQGMEDYGLRDREPWINALEGTTVDTPLLVERLDFDLPHFYYLVPFFRSAGAVPVLANVDAYTEGSLVGAIAVPDGTTHFGDALDRETVIQTFAGQVVESGEVSVPLKADDLFERLVWRPCAESLSPYWPFYRFDADRPGGGKIPIYVRIDGVLFPALHEDLGM